MLDNIGLMRGIGGKMNYLNQSQVVTSENIANADTPEYRPRDLTEVDFGAVLSEVTGSKKVRMDRTTEGHIMPGGDLDSARNRKSRMTYEVAPADNAVIIEEQMVKATQTTMDYNLMTNLMRKNVGMIQTAIGKGR